MEAFTSIQSKASGVVLKSLEKYDTWAGEMLWNLNVF